MRIGHWPQSRIAYRSKVEFESRAFTERMRVMNSHRHDEIVGMLAVHQRRAVSRLAGLEQFRIAAFGDREGIQTQHEIELNTAVTDIVTCGEHAPVGRVELVSAARAGLL